MRGTIYFRRHLKKFLTGDIEISKKTLLILVLIALGIISGIYINPLSWLQKQSSSQINSEYGKMQNTADTIIKSCTNSKSQEQCYSRMLADVTTRNTPQYAIQMLHYIQRNDPASRGCHLISHAISTAAVQKNPADWSKILAEMPLNECTGGFIHGVIEARQLYDHSFVINSATIPKICENVRQYTNKVNDDNCSHILGHLTMVTEIGDIQKAVGICDALPEEMQFECNSGIFMENETRENLVAHSMAKHIPWNLETMNDQEILCNSYTGVSYAACWKELGHMFSFVTHNDPLQVFLLCKKASTTESVQDCYQHSVGIMTASSSFDLRNMVKLCQPYTDDEKQFQYCYTMAINSMLGSTPQNVDKAVSLCSSLPSDVTADCYAKVGKRLAMSANPTDPTDYCAAIPEEYQAMCYGFKSK